MTFVKTALFHKAGEGSGGGGGGDQHNLGWYATESALTTAHATASDGDWAIVGATDTVWVWDSDTTAWKDTGQAGIELPSQTGNSGKFLTTNGTSPSWSDKPLVNRATGTNGIGIGGSSLVASGNNSIAVGPNPQATASGAIAIGVDARATVADGIAIGDYARSSANKAYQIGSGTNGTANSFQVGSHQLLNLSDGTIPEARLADTTNAAQGQVLALDSNLDAVWTTPSGGGLPSQTGQSGKFLTTDGTDASWGDVVKQHTIKYDGGDLPAPNGTPVDVLTFAGTKNGSTIYPAKIKLHDSGMNLWGSNADFAVRIEGNLLGNGTIGRNVFGVIDKWNKIFVSKISSGAQDISVPNTTGTMAVIQVNTTITLTAAGWSSNTQTVSVTGMTATGIVLVSPDPTDQSAYTSAGIICSAQAAGTLTFTCSTTPTADLSVNVVML